MPDLSQYTFRQSNLTIACEPIAEYLRSQRDFSDERKYLYGDEPAERQLRVLFGLDRPELSANVMPALRLWIDSQAFPVASNELFIREYMTTLSIYHYGYCAEPKDAARLMREWCEQTIYSIQHPESGATDVLGTALGIESQEPYWWFMRQQNIVADHTTTFRRISGAAQLLPPLYASRVDVQIIASLNKVAP